MKEHQAGYDRIAKSKTILVLDHPFYGTLAMNTPVTIDETAVLPDRSEEHTSELQSRRNLVCRLLLEKKKQHKKKHQHNNSSVIE